MIDRIVESAVVALVLTAAWLVWRTSAPREPAIRLGKMTPESLASEVRTALVDGNHYYAAYPEGVVDCYLLPGAQWRVKAGARNKVCNSPTEAGDFVGEWYAEATGRIGPRRAAVRSVPPVRGKA